MKPCRHNNHQQTNTMTKEQEKNIGIFKREIRRLLIELKPQIADEYRVSDDPEDNTPGMCVTVSTKDLTTWSYQTGDNSFTGSCYGDPHWAVIYLNRRSNCGDLANEAVEELADLVAQSE